MSKKLSFSNGVPRLRPELGSRNYFDENSIDFARGVGSWLTDNGSGSPSPGLSVTTTTTPGEALSVAGSLKLTKDAANRNGHFIKVLSKTIEPSDRGQANFGSFSFKGLTGYVGRDIIWEVFDVTNSEVLFSGIPEDLELFDGAGKFNWVTYVESTTAQIEFRARINNTNTNSFSCVLDNFEFGPASQLNASIITEWQEFPGSIIGTTSGTVVVGVGGIQKFEYRRVGSNVEVRYRVRFGSSGFVDAVGAYSFPLPPVGTVVDQTYSVVGIGDITVLASANPVARIVGKMFSNRVVFNRTDAALMGSGDGVFFNNSNEFNFKGSVEIAEWSAGSLLNTNELRQQAIVALLAKSDVQAIPTGVVTKVNLNVAVDDKFSTLQSNSFVCPKDGYLNIHGQVGMGNGPANFHARIAVILQNSVEKLTGQFYVNPNIVTGARPEVSGILPVKRNDIIDLAVFQDSGSSINTIGGNNQTKLDINYLPNMTVLGAVRNNEIIQIGAEPFINPSFTASTYQDIVSFTVPAGEWDVEALVKYDVPSTLPGVVALINGISKFPGNNSTGLTFASSNTDSDVTGTFAFQIAKNLPRLRVTETQDTTYYLKQTCTGTTNLVRLLNYVITLKRV